MSKKLFQIMMGILCLAIIGCAASPPAQFYLLTPIPGAATLQCDDPSSPVAAVGVDPVLLADYLNRPQIMVRSEPNRIEPAEFHRWAGSLERAFGQVLIDNLGLLLATDKIVVYPSNSMAQHDYRVAVQVLQFDGGIDRQVTLQARWTISDHKNQKTVASCKMTVAEPVKGEGYQNLVLAMSEAAAQLSTHIALELKRHISAL